MIYLLLVLLLILVNAYFSAAEIAFVSVRKFRVQELADSGDNRARQVLDILKKPDEYFSSIQIGVTLIGLFEGLYGGEFLQAYLEPRLLAQGMPLWSAHALSIAVGIGLITYITVIMGELVPKSIAVQTPQRIAFLITPTFRLFSFIAYPFIRVLTGSTHMLLKMFSVTGPETPNLSDNDLKNLLSLAYTQGTLEKNELELHQNIFTFYDQTIEKLMTPAEKVVLINEEMTAESIENVLRNSVHNFFPVVGQNNKVVGYLSARDFFIKREKPLKEVTIAACTVFGDQNAPKLLQNFKTYNTNFGVVVNERNELLGVITMHDMANILIGEFA
jgi:putative hemolysin